MGSVFRPFAQPRNLVSERDQMAYDLAKEMIEAHKARQQAAKDADAKGEPFDWTPEDQERIDTLDALMKGRHRHVVLPLMLEAFTQLTEPARADNKPMVSKQGLKLDLCELENGRFEDIIHALDVKDECALCGRFRPEMEARYRCHIPGSCIAATLHPDLQSYLRVKLGWQDEESHTRVIGQTNNESGAEQALAGPCTQSEPEAD